MTSSGRHVRFFQSSLCVIAGGLKLSIELRQVCVAKIELADIDRGQEAQSSGYAEG